MVELTAAANADEHAKVDGGPPGDLARTVGAELVELTLEQLFANRGLLVYVHFLFLLMK